MAGGRPPVVIIESIEPLRDRQKGRRFHLTF
jgi:hypothetical protein